MRARPAFALAVVVNLVALYSPRGAGEQLFPGVDKIVHAGIFGAVMVTGRWARIPAVPLALVLLAHAVESELVQAHLLPMRDGSAYDVLADWIGVVIGLGVAAWAGWAVRRRNGRDGSAAHEEELLHE